MAVKSTSNFLSPSRFVIVLNDGGLSYHCTSVQLPTVTVDESETPFRNQVVRHPGTMISFSPFDAQFIVEEDLSNYMTLLEWMLAGAKKSDNKTNDEILDIKRDITLLIYSNNNNLSKKINFIGAFPTSLSTIDFSTMLTETEYSKCDVSFTFDYFHITS